MPDPLTDRVQEQLAERREDSRDEAIPEHVRLRVLQEAAADPEVVERLAQRRWERPTTREKWPPSKWPPPNRVLASALRTQAEEDLEYVLLNVCPTCHGSGEVQANRSRDPQEAYEERCGRCGGTGVVG